MLSRNDERKFLLRREAWKIFRTSTGFEPATSRYRCDALTNWAMKPLTLAAGHFWVHNFPWLWVKDIYEIHHTLAAGHFWVLNFPWEVILSERYIWNTSYIALRVWNQMKPCCLAVMSANLYCVEKPEKFFRTSTGFEPATSRYRCDALTNWAMKPLTLTAGHF